MRGSGHTICSICEADLNISLSSLIVRKHTVVVKMTLRRDVLVSGVAHPDARISWQVVKMTLRRDVLVRRRRGVAHARNRAHVAIMHPNQAPRRTNHDAWDPDSGHMSWPIARRSVAHATSIMDGGGICAD